MSLLVWDLIPQTERGLVELIPSDSVAFFTLEAGFNLVLG